METSLHVSFIYKAILLYTCTLITSNKILLQVFNIVVYIQLKFKITS